MRELNQIIQGLVSKSEKTDEIAEFVSNLGFEEEVQSHLVDLATNNRNKLENTKELHLKKNLPILDNFEWRLEIEVGSRARKKTFNPNYLLNFEFLEKKIGENGNVEDSRSNLLLNSEMGCLKKLSQEFEALNSFSKSITYRKLNRGL